MKPNQIICGDNIDVVKFWETNCVDGIVTDPPYGLGFMGKKWDTLIEKTRDSAGGFLRDGKSGSNPYAAARCRHGSDSMQMQEWYYQWAKAMFRITKPGGFLLCFGGTRTYHRLACAIEDAGWEIRDCMMWLYASGFPKGRNYAYDIHKKAESEAKHDLRFVQQTYLSTAIYACKECGQVLLTCLSEQDAPQLWKTWAKSKIAGGEQSSVEGWSHLETPERELQRCSVCSMSHQIFADGSKGRIHNGTSTCDGKTTPQIIDTNRSSPPSRPQSEQQSNQEPYAVSLERLAQAHRGNNIALKPAWEPIIVAMKPLDGTFAHNAERHGVAGLNIDGGRINVDSDDKLTKAVYKGSNPGEAGKTMGDGWANQGQNVPMWSGQGRWPANLVLDEEAGKMLDEQSGISKSIARTKPSAKNEHTDSGGASRFFKVLEPESCFLCGYTEEHGNLEVGPGVFLCDECLLRGEALDLPKRFLYCAKTSRKERNMGMENCEDKLLARSGGAQGAENRGEKEYLQKHIGLNRVVVVKNNHPTVKPLALMKYLCTLLKMPSADQIILDPFLGSGTTGIACKELGINFIGIEKEPEYCEISVKRIAAIKGKEITLQTSLPVTKNVETFRTTKDFAGGSRRPDENLPHVSEHRQSIIDAASAALRRNRK